MYDPGMLYLIAKCHQNDLLQQAEQHRLASSVPNKWPTFRSAGSKMITWFREKLPNNEVSNITSFDRRPASTPCCTETNS